LAYPSSRKDIGRASLSRPWRDWPREIPSQHIIKPYFYLFVNPIRSPWEKFCLKFFQQNYH
jgi:hypothetical protein